MQERRFDNASPQRATRHHYEIAERGLSWCEPSLAEVNGKVFKETTANTRPEARLDISALGFRTPDQRVFFDIRVFNLQAQRYRWVSWTEEMLREERKEKKRQYNEKVHQIENGSFYPLSLATNGVNATRMPRVLQKNCRNDGWKEKYKHFRCNKRYSDKDKLLACPLNVTMYKGKIKIRKWK